jgi:hypothetical protein
LVLLDKFKESIFGAFWNILADRAQAESGADRVARATWAAFFTLTALGSFATEALAAFDHLAGDRIHAPGDAAEAAALEWVEVAFFIATSVIAVLGHVTEGCIERSNAVQALSAGDRFFGCGSNVAAFDLVSGPRIHTPTVSGRSVVLNDFEVAAFRAFRNECAWSEESGHDEFGAWTNFLVGSWLVGCWVSANGVVSGSNIAALDLLTGLGINAPTVSGAAAALGRVEVAVIIALGFRFADDHASVQERSQLVEALSTDESLVGRWFDIGALDFVSIFWVDAPTESGRSVALDHLPVTAR